MKNKRFPIVTKELIEELEKRFPDTCPEPTLSLDEIRFKQGQIAVVRLLRTWFDAQTKTVLENK